MRARAAFVVRVQRRTRLYALPSPRKGSREKVSVRLHWDGKPRHLERLSLPFQTVETINESRATRERDRGSLLPSHEGAAGRANRLIWGDNKLVMTSLLRDYAGRIKLIYIDPPFDTGADFSYRIPVGDGRNDSPRWPQGDGLKWPHPASVS
jgi:hypothetical protein